MQDRTHIGLKKEGKKGGKKGGKDSGEGKSINKEKDKEKRHTGEKGRDKNLWRRKRKHYKEEEVSERFKKGRGSLINS
jgi:hypothetical protein